jgi:hypothetical protein
MNVGTLHLSVNGTNHGVDLLSGNGKDCPGNGVVDDAERPCAGQYSMQKSSAGSGGDRTFQRTVGFIWQAVLAQ